MPLKKTFAHSYNCFTPFGEGLKTNIDHILNGDTAVKLGQNKHFEYFAAQIEEEKINSFLLPDYYTRLEKMMIISLLKTLENNPIHSKTGLIISTTKGNINFLSNPPLNKKINLNQLARTIKEYFNFMNEPLIISNACVSGVHAISVAKRLINMGLYEDVVIVGGDELSLFVLAGFESFKALGSSVCKPYSMHRDGISLGEATASLIVSSKPVSSNCFEILGDANINDSNHISGPSRTGEGLYLSIKKALEKSNVSPNDIEYISAHGTATPYNDEMESIAFNRANLQNVPLNSLKGYFGHTLGAAGLLETIIAFEMINKNQLFRSYGFDELGVSKPLNVIGKHQPQVTKYFLKTASGFGGTNSAIIFKKF